MHIKLKLLYKILIIGYFLFLLVILYNFLFVYNILSIMLRNQVDNNIFKYIILKIKKIIKF